MRSMNVMTRLTGIHAWGISGPSGPGSGGNAPGTSGPGSGGGDHPDGPDTGSGSGGGRFGGRGREGGGDRSVSVPGGRDNRGSYPSRATPGGFLGRGGGGYADRGWSGIGRSRSTDQAIGLAARGVAAGLGTGKGTQTESTRSAFQAGLRMAIGFLNPQMGLQMGLRDFFVGPGSFGRMVANSVRADVASARSHMGLLSRYGVNPITGLGGDKAGLLADPDFQAYQAQRSAQLAEMREHGAHIPDPWRPPAAAQPGDPADPGPGDPGDPEGEDPEDAINRPVELLRPPPGIEGENDLWLAANRWNRNLIREGGGTFYGVTQPRDPNRPRRPNPPELIIGPAEPGRRGMASRRRGSRVAVV